LHLFRQSQSDLKFSMQPKILHCSATTAKIKA
jgi:hypothetical protein